MRNLRLSIGASNTDTRHPQIVMRDLGVTYDYAIPKSIADQWWFLNCKNVPDVLPEFVSYMENFDPTNAVGYGLSQEMADDLVKKAN